MINIKKMECITEVINKISSSSGMALAESVNFYRKNQPENYKEFKRLKYKENIFLISDSVLIRNEEDFEKDFVGIINKIILVNTPDELQPIVELIWFLHSLH